jgi:allantoicase
MFNRRHNKDTHHTAIIQLATAGTIAGFDIDTSFFDGSHPSYASVEGCLIVQGVKDSYEVRISEDATEHTFVVICTMKRGQFSVSLFY